MKFLYYFIIASKFTSGLHLNGLHLNGPIGKTLTSYSVPKSISYKYIQKYEIEQIKLNSHIDICNELRDVRQKLRSSDDNNVVFFVDNKTNKHIFTVIYRMDNGKFPITYTIESILRTPGIEFKSNDMQNILKKMVYDRSGYIQLHELKQWFNGKYAIENYLESQLTAD